MYAWYTVDIKLFYIVRFDVSQLFQNTRLQDSTSDHQLLVNIIYSPCKIIYSPYKIMKSVYTTK